MDRDVHRVDRAAGAACVARVFPVQRGVPAVEGDEAILGALLGRLHSRPARATRPGDAWHHLCPQGGPAEDIADRAIRAMREPAAGSSPV